jgi:RHS repeat-associated protein
VERTQTLTWDAFGRLLAVVDRDTNNSGFNWSAVYDSLNRRLQTTSVLVSNGVAATAPAQSVNSYFDPQREFLELGVQIGSQTTWKLLGPDLNGIYGGENGAGGLEGVSPYLNTFNPVISDFRGNVLAEITNGAVSWNASRPTAYGAVPGYRPAAFGNGADMAQSSAWRGREVDITGFYNIGVRPYDPVSGRWLAFDPAWNSGDPDGYTFCAGGDPVNGFDPDGRALYAQDGTWNFADEAVNGVPAPTNVRRFYDAYDPSQRRFYYAGIGNSEQHGPFMQFFEGVTGSGTKAILNQEYADLVKNYNAGDRTIDLVGFSRGAAGEMEFTHMIYERGVPDLTSARTITVGSPRMQTTRTIYDNYLLPPGAANSIRFAGFFDPVHAMGLPGAQWNLGYHTADIAPNVQHAYVAYAANERRLPFAQTDIPSATSVIFPGVHSDVGGGNGNIGLNDTSFRWMLNMASSSGLQFSPVTLNPNPNAPPNPVEKWYFPEGNRTFPPYAQNYSGAMLSKH